MLTPTKKSRWTFCIGIALILLWLPIGPAFGFGLVIRVPADQPTINDAIRLATTGDTILVAPGVYFERVNVYKAITLGSLFLVTGDERYIDETVISGARGYERGGLAVANVHDGRATVSGFTIRDCETGNGGGVMVAGAHRLDHLNIVNNFARGVGGGVLASGSPLLTNVKIIGNRAGSGLGSPYPGAGGGIIYSSSPLDLGVSRMVLRNVVIADNLATTGGGIYIDVDGSHSDRQVKIHLENTVVEGNLSEMSEYNMGGGGIWARFLYERSELSIRNSIIRNNNNSHNDLPDILLELSKPSTMVSVEYSNVSGGKESIVMLQGGNLQWLSGNIDAEESWVDAGGDDYRLGAGSPGIDSGNVSVADNDGCLPPGLGSARNDMGAYGGPGNCGVPPVEVPGFPLDGCPDDPNKIGPGVCGCGIADTDSDHDGTPDCRDGCSHDPSKIAPGACGCGIADTADSDHDGTPDCRDGCSYDPSKIVPGACGCGVADTADSDHDGTPDCRDGCSYDPSKIVPGACGCGVADTDSDHDGTPDCRDGCSYDPNKIVPGVCGCGVADTDSDGDGTSDCIDPNSVSDDLQGIINNLNVPLNVTNSYTANLKKVSGFIDAGQTNAALNQLDNLLKKVVQDVNHELLTAQEGAMLEEKINYLIILITG